MKRTHIVVGMVVLLAAWLSLRELHWHLEHSALMAIAHSPAGDATAEAYSLDEGGGQPYGRGPAPYGVGVYVRKSYLPLKSFGATLVFASYCGPDVELHWLRPEELRIECASEEAPKLLLASHDGLRITYVQHRVRQ